MTVAELIEILKDQPQDAVVWRCDGWGLSDPAVPSDLWLDDDEEPARLHL